MTVAFRRHTLVPPDEGPYALPPSIPHLTRNRTKIVSWPIRFDMICEDDGIEHRLSKPNHPRTMCGWPPHGKGVVRVRHLAGRGPVYGVEDAAVCSAP